MKKVSPNLGTHLLSRIPLCIKDKADYKCDCNNKKPLRYTAKTHHNTSNVKLFLDRLGIVFLFSPQKPKNIIK